MERPRKTECIHQPTGGVSPYVEFSVEWGEGEDAMNAAGAMAKKEPGIDNPYAGVGDQAVAVGTSLMIRSGKDLVTITFSGVDHAPAKAKKIFDLWAHSASYVVGIGGGFALVVWTWRARARCELDAPN